MSAIAKNLERAKRAASPSRRAFFIREAEALIDETTDAGKLLAIFLQAIGCEGFSLSEREAYMRRCIALASNDELFTGLSCRLLVNLGEQARALEAQGQPFGRWDETYSLFESLKSGATEQKELVEQAFRFCVALR